MKRPKTLPAFTRRQADLAKRLLATKVATMMGRKFEEDDWASVYCQAKDIPNTGWSNLNIDVMYNGLGVEHKMLKRKSNRTLLEWCGQTLMHPAATRSIRIPSTDGDPNEVMADVLAQYAQLIESRRAELRKESPPGTPPDLRTGWLLWQESLDEFLYFEEESLPPDPADYFAEWVESGGGSSRKASINLWVYEHETGQKRFSITTSAGAKIQPYFDVPPPNDPNLYLFKVQGEEVRPGVIRVWVTRSTGRELKRLLGELTLENLSSRIVTAAGQIEDFDEADTLRSDLAIALEITEDAYDHLKEAFAGVSDEHMMRLFVQYLHRSMEV